MAIEHDSIPNADLHEPKGVSTASSSQIYVADGAASGAWRYVPHSYLYYDNIGTGTTITTPTTYTLVGPTTTGDADPREFTHNSAGRLTYTGATTMDFSLAASVTFKHTTGTGQDCYFQIHKNGSPAPGTQVVRTADSGNYGSVVIVGHGELATNDYIELYCKVATGSIVVHAFSFDVIGML